MSPSRLLPLVLVALIAGAGGYFLGRGSAGTPAGDTKPQPPEVKSAPSSPRPATVPAVLSGEVMTLVGTEKITAANAQAVAYRILAEADPLRRMTACMVLLESMNAENAGKIMAAFSEITEKSGRKHDEEWGLMLRRFGAVRGVEGVKELLSDGHSAGMAMEGYAAADPEGAEQALKELGEANPDLRNYWLSGLCVKDPQRALLLAFGGDYNEANGKTIIQQAINAAGVLETKEMMQKALDKGDEDIEGQGVFKSAFRQLNDSLFHWNWTRGTPGEMLPWILEQRTAPYVEAWMVNRAVKDNFLAGDPKKAVEFLVAVNAGRNSVRGTGDLYTSLEQNPAAVVKLSDDEYKQLAKFLYPTTEGEFEAVVEAVEKLNPERAALMRANKP